MTPNPPSGTTSTPTPQSYTMFWGCTIPYRLPFIELAIRKTWEKLGVSTTDLPFSCCPDPGGIQSFDIRTWTTLAARNLTLAEEKGLNIISACNGCFETLKIADSYLRKDKALQSSVNNTLKIATGRVWKGTTKLTHILEYLIKDITIAKLKAKIVRPLTGMKVVTHVGCHFMRPHTIMQTDDPNYPVLLKRILQDVLDIETVPYFGETSCCGAGVRGVDSELALDMAHNKLHEMDQANEISGIVVTCPTCFNSFDGQQKLVNRKFGRNVELPVFHLFELLAIGMGVSAGDLGLQSHLVKVDSGNFASENRRKELFLTH